MNSPKFSQDPSQFSGSSEPRSSIANTAKEATAKVANTAKETAAKVASTAKEATAKVTAAAGDAASRVKEGAENLVSEKKSVVADRVDSYGSAIHETARSLEEQDPNIAWLTHRAAERLEGVANYVRTRDFAGLRDDAASLARRHPAAFFGGMCVAGLVLGSVIRAARSSSKESSYGSSEYNTEESDYPNYMSEEKERVSSLSGETSFSGGQNSLGIAPSQNASAIPEI